MIFKSFRGFAAILALIIVSGFHAAFGQAPNISYPAYPPIFALNTPITALIPNNSGGTVPATPYGQVSTIAGSGIPGYFNSNGTAAQFRLPEAIVADAAGNLYVADAGNNVIRKITPAGVVTTLAGSATGASGNMDGLGTAALFSEPDGIAIDAAGNLFVSDYTNNAIREITPAGLVSTFVTGINGPSGLCFDGSGNLLVAEQAASLIIKITPAKVITTISGSTYGYFNSPTAAAAQFEDPSDIQIDGAGNIFVADYLNNALRKITPAGTVTTLAGSNAYGNTGAYADGAGTAAQFNNLTGVAIGSGDIIYVSDLLNNDIRRVMPDGTVTLVAGSATQASGTADGLASSALFFHPVDLYIDATGTGYVADSRNGMIRKILLTGYSIDRTLPPGLSFNTATGAISGTPTAATSGTPYTITAYNATGNFSVTLNIATGTPATPAVPRPHIAYQTPQTYTTNVPITPLAPVSTGGVVPPTLFGRVTTFAGHLSASGHADATGTASLFDNLWGIDKDAANNLYVSDNSYIRKITPGAVVTSLAGGPPGNSAAGFLNIAGLAVASSGNVFVGDINSLVVKKTTPAGVVSTFAGTGITSFNPVGVTSDPSGNIFIADQANSVIRKISPAGIVTVYAGLLLGGAGSTNGNSTIASFNYPADLKFDNSGNLYVADERNNMIREISSAGIVSTVAGTTSPDLVNGPIANARFNQPSALAIDAANNIYVADSHGLVIRMINQLGEVVAVAGDIQFQFSSDGIGGTATFKHIAGLVYSKGSVYATDATCVRQIIVTGYTINKPLPNGLVFDSTTGIISGTPTDPSPATTYTITAYNEGGNYASSVVITVIPPPPHITYPTPQVYTVNTAILPLQPTNTGGAITSFSIDHPLPPGLIFNTTTGIISGTPTTVSPATDYIITAINSGGSDPFTINITVNPIVLMPQTITFGQIPAKTYGDADFNPGAISTNNTIPITYGSNNIAIATIVNGNIHINGAGTATITASQAGNANFITASPVSRLLTINRAAITITADDKTKTFGSPNPPLTASYVGLVYGESPSYLTVQPVITTTAIETSPVGDYPITVSGAASTNYTFTYVPGKLTIRMVLPTIVIPNVFTPNGDGINDVWNINALTDYPQCLVSVYNRYGGLVYQSKGYSKPWDGTYGGSQVPPGTYYYIIDPKNGVQQLSGFVAILR